MTVTQVVLPVLPVLTDVPAPSNTSLSFHLHYTVRSNPQPVMLPTRAETYILTFDLLTKELEDFEKAQLILCRVIL